MITGSTNSNHSQREKLFRASSILVVDDEPGMCNFFNRALVNECALVRIAASVEEAEKIRQREYFDLLIADIRLPETSGVEWIKSLRDQGNQSDVIFITAFADIDTAIAALRLAASDFLLKPFRLEQLLTAIERCLERRHALRENILLKRQLNVTQSDKEIIGNSSEIIRMTEVIRKVAPSSSTVLIEGETGTGKELVARQIHELSGKSGPFVPVNCSAISAELIESELFGHAKGAFTGATNAREGLFSFANDGTLFLDEISEMPLHMQSQLLRVLEEKSVRAVGSDQEIPINVRVIAATNRHLAKEVEEGRFRHDLYYRLEVVTLRVPPLRNRIDDIPQLSEHFLLELSHSLQTQPMVLTYEEISELKSYSWPGNVRELKNVLERYMLLGKFPYQTLSNSADMASSESKKSGFPVSWDIETVERHHVANVLNATGANKSEAARTLGISRKTLDRKLSKWKSNAVKP